MKILYSHRTRSADGQYVHIRELTNALRCAGADIHMHGPEGEGANARRNLDAGADEGRGLKDYLPGAVYELAESAYSIPAYQRLSKAYRAAAPDILYERYNLFYHAGAWLARKNKLPFILEINAPLVQEREKHGGLSLKSFAARSEASLWRAADHVLPVTGVLAAIVEKAGVPAEKITVIQNGVSEEFLCEVDPRPVREQFGLDGKIVLGFTGFVRDWHGVDKILHYMAASERKDLHLLLVGDGPEAKKLTKLAGALGVSDRFTITGVKQREEMPRLVAAFDIALQPAVVAYASPLKLFEYMALGKAIVAPASANILEVLTDGADAMLFEEGDDAALFGCLDKLIADQTRREEIGAAARASLLRQKLTWAGNAERVMEIAEKLLERNK